MWQINMVFSPELIALLIISTVTCIVSFIAFWRMKALQNIMEEINKESIANLKTNRDEITTNIANILNAQSTATSNQFNAFSQTLKNLTELNENKLENIRKSVEEGLYKLQTENNEKLEKMRATVEEKLHETLENRLSKSFQVVSDRLEQVFKGLGEMQSLAAGVGDLKKVLTNVKTRGIWGEVQLHALIEQVLSPQQYEQNAKVNPNSSDRVEFAIKIPNKDDLNTSTYLPIDAKFPIEDYQKLLEAYEIGDIQALDSARKNMEAAILRSAKIISEKYISPPHTTDFAMMYLPIEGLYAELLKKPGIIETLQRDYRVVVTSPTTLLAIMNSLQIGFRAIVIEKRSNEVWKVLANVKTEFNKFADVLSKTRVKLDQASKVIGDAEVRTRALQRHLKQVETIPQNDNDLAIEPLLDLKEND